MQRQLGGGNRKRQEDKQAEGKQRAWRTEAEELRFYKVGIFEKLNQQLSTSVIFKIIPPNICREPAACKTTFKPFLPYLIRANRSWRLADPEIHLRRTNRHSAGTKSEHIVKIILSAFLDTFRLNPAEQHASPASETRKYGMLQHHPNSRLHYLLPSHYKNNKS